MPENSGRPENRGARAKIETQRAAEHRTRRRRRVLIALGSIIIAAAVIIAIVVSFPSSSSSAKTGPEGIALQSGEVLAPSSTAASGQTVDGIACSATEQVAYHIHSHLAVYVDGQSRSIPYGIGVVMPVPTTTANGVFVQASNCYYWLHTHASDGIIHVESPAQTQYTLGQFFDIWQQPLSATQVGPATGTVTAYVDGKPYTGDPRGITLQPHEDIQLDVGAPTVPPQPVDWSRSQL
jgi:hypothetical protein